MRDNANLWPVKHKEPRETIRTWSLIMPAITSSFSFSLISVLGLIGRWLLIFEILCIMFHGMFFIARYSYGQLIEINSHSLFSKWFSEVSWNNACFKYIIQCLSIWIFVQNDAGTLIFKTEWKVGDENVSENSRTDWWQRCISLCVDWWGMKFCMRKPSLPCRRFFNREAHFSSLPTNACTTEDNIPFPLFIWPINSCEIKCWQAEHG